MRSGASYDAGTLSPHMITPDEIVAGDRFGTKVVAVIGGTSKDWAAYRGPTGWSDQDVAETGDKISEQAAKALFPTIAANFRYRN